MSDEKLRALGIIAGLAAVGFAYVFGIFSRKR